MSGQHIEKQLEEIADHLMQISPEVYNPGLLHGKMGIAIFFFHLYRYSNDEKYADCGYTLIEELQSQINNKTSPFYESGLSGIGTGIEYLVQNGFVEGDTDEILQDVDRQIIFTIKFMPHQHFSIRKGLCGLGRYLLYRKSNRNSSFSTNPETDQMLERILRIIEARTNNLLTNKQNLISIEEWTDVLAWLYEAEEMNLGKEKSYRSIIRVLEPLDLSRKDIRFIYNDLGLFPGITPPGLDGGYAAKGLCLLEKISMDERWKKML